MLFIRRLPEVISVFRLGSFGRKLGRSASGVLHFPQRGTAHREDEHR